MSLLNSIDAGFSHLGRVVSLRRLTPVIAAVLAFGAGGCVAPAPASANVVPDKAFQACLNSLLDQDASADITGAQLGSLHGQVNCPGNGVVSLEGAQYLANTTDLNLSGHRVSDLTPLSGLTSLTTLHLDNSGVSDLGPLAGLTDLSNLYLDNNQISDLAPLSGLGSLKSLRLNRNQVSDVSPLAGLTSLTSLGMVGNQVSDVTALAGLRNLWGLDLSENRISDLSPLGDWQHSDCLPYGCEFYATSQEVDLGTVMPGTVSVPIVTTAGHEMVVDVQSGPAVINGDGTITYTAAGSVVLTWDTPWPNPQSSNKFFSGTATVTVVAQ
ncbi:MAG: leucine-rich repeat domain-containing protein [Propionibacteriaceae bacterium]|nr:leucine-rich repeat domain-containing protein [Propionibacteriaceae bacterium]